MSDKIIETWTVTTGGSSEVIFADAVQLVDGALMFLNNIGPPPAVPCLVGIIAAGSWQVISRGGKVKVT